MRRLSATPKLRVLLLGSLTIHLVVIVMVNNSQGRGGQQNLAQARGMVQMLAPLDPPARSESANSPAELPAPEISTPETRIVPEEAPVSLIAPEPLDARPPAFPLYRPRGVEEAILLPVQPEPKPVSVTQAPMLDPERCAAPEYPRSARRLGQEGVVWLRIRVDGEGIPCEVVIHSGSGHAALDAAALAAAKNWRLRPALRDGRPCEGLLLVPVRFQLER